jgi:mRNA interferase MazF
MSEEFTKDFAAWNQVKQRIDGLSGVPGFNAREIWWCSIGTNIGSEICGKGDKFSRPILILKRTSPTMFIGIPATSKQKIRWDYHPVTIKGQLSYLQLSGVRSLDARRLVSKIEKLSEHVFADVLTAFYKIFSPAP